MIETRVKQPNAAAIVANLGVWNFWFNYDDAANGRIWVMAKKSLNMVLLQQTSQMMHFVVKLPKMDIAITFIYGSNSSQERRQLWTDLLNILHSHSMPWLLLGDFNVVRDPSECMQRTAPSLRMQL